MRITAPGICAGIAAAAVVLAQGLDPQEIHLTSEPYVPRTGFALKTETRLVDVGVVVRDDRGHSIGGLTKDDFLIADNGRKHDIAAFSVQTFTPAGTREALAPKSADGQPAPPPAVAVKPRFVALVFDNISMPPDDLFHSKAAAKSFLKSGLAVNDAVAVYTISEGLVLPYTKDNTALAQAIDKVVLRQRKQDRAGCPLLTEYDAYLIANRQDNSELDVKAQEYANCSNICGAGGGGRSRRGSTTPAACQRAYQDVQSMSNSLWEMVRMQSLSTIYTIRNIVDVLGKLNGTRVMLFASSGFLAGTLDTEQDDVIDRALHANVVINYLDAKGLYTEDAPVMGMGATTRSVIQQQLLGTRPKEETNSAAANFADSTGGLFFHNNNDLDLGFRELGMQPDVSYLMAFAPDAPDGKYHHLKVTLNNKKRGHVQARLGYMSLAAPAAKPLPERPIDHEVLSGREIADVPVKVESRADKLDDGRPVARMTIYCDVAKLGFHLENGGYSKSLHIIAALLDANGNFITGKEGEVQFSLKEATYQKTLASGMKLGMSLEAAPGAYRLRTVIADEGDRHLSTSTQPLELK